MINNRMRYYKYFKYQDNNEYGQMTLSDTPSGEVKIAVFVTSETIQQNINYKDASYIGLTKSSVLDDKSVVLYGDIKLKVLYVIPDGRYKQVFFQQI